MHVHSTSVVECIHCIKAKRFYLLCTCPVFTLARLSVALQAVCRSRRRCVYLLVLCGHLLVFTTECMPACVDCVTVFV